MTRIIICLALLFSLLSSACAQSAAASKQSSLTPAQPQTLDATAANAIAAQLTPLPPTAHVSGTTTFTTTLPPSDVKTEYLLLYKQFHDAALQQNPALKQNPAFKTDQPTRTPLFLTKAETAPPSLQDYVRPHQAFCYVWGGFGFKNFTIAEISAGEFKYPAYVQDKDAFTFDVNPPDPNTPAPLIPISLTVRDKHFHEIASDRPSFLKQPIKAVLHWATLRGHPVIGGSDEAFKTSDKVGARPRFSLAATSKSTRSWISTPASWSFPTAAQPPPRPASRYPSTSALFSTSSPDPHPHPLRPARSAPSRAGHPHRSGHGPIRFARPSPRTSQPGPAPADLAGPGDRRSPPARADPGSTLSARPPRSGRWPPRGSW